MGRFRMRSKSIKILGQDYSLKVVGKKDLPKQTVGICNSTKNEILLSKNLNGDKKIEVMLHEVIHAVSEMLLIGLKEEQVNNLAVGLLPYIDRNKLICRVTK